MDTTLKHPTRSSLQKAVFANGVFSGISGAFLAAFAHPFAGFVGLESQVPVMVIGVVLLLYSPALFFVSAKAPVNLAIAWLVIGLDALWVLASVLLIFTDLVPLTIQGKWMIAILADVVAIFAVLQYLGVRKQAGNSASD